MAEESLKAADGNHMTAMALAQAGLTHMFGVVGIPVTGLANACVARGIRFVAFRNEQAAGYAAAAHSYLTSAPSLLLTVSGPGCVHALPALAHCQANVWPLILISGSCDQASAGKGDFQELDQLAATRPFTKFSGRATTIREIPAVVANALASSALGRPGPVYIDLPSDVLHQTVPYGEALELAKLVPPFVPTFQNPSPSPELFASGQAVDEAAALLRHAERPLIVFGKGAAYARAETELQELVKLTGIPFLPTPMGKGLVSDTHPRAATAARSLALAQCDVALVVGARLNWLLHFGEPPKWSPNVKFVLIDIDKSEIDLRKPHQGLVGDALLVLNQLNKAIKDDPFYLGDSHPWIEKLVKKARDNVERMEMQLQKDVVPLNFMTPLRIIRDAIIAEGSPAPVVVSEGANTMDLGRAVLVQTEPRTRLDAGTWGTMGVGLGFCVAAAMAMPERLVVAVEGDSAFGFSGMELETLVRYQLPVVVIVFNNNGVYGGDRRNPEEISGPYKDDPAPTSFVPEAAYHTMMEAFGGKGYLASTPQELKSALTDSFSARKPALINVMLDPYAGTESGRMQHKN
ncbi:hypothetical protein AMTRI_Chr13g116280 [Amborella trichopoda]